MHFPYRRIPLSHNCHNSHQHSSVTKAPFIHMSVLHVVHNLECGNNKPILRFSKSNDVSANIAFPLAGASLRKSGHYRIMQNIVVSP